MADLMDTAVRIAAALKLRKSGKDWRGVCPSCKDTNPSFSMTAAPDTLLVHCFAGCEQSAVIGALREIDPALWPTDMPAPKQARGTGGRFAIYGVAELLRRPPVAWLIKNVLPARGIISLIGEPGCGKSFLALDMIGALLGRQFWFDNRVKEVCPVLYIAAEGGRGFPQRVRAYQRTYQGAEWGMLGMITDPINFLEPGDVADLVTAIEARANVSGKPGLMIVDTVNQTMRGADENSVEGMSKYLYGIGQVTAHFDFCTLLIHHTGKDASRGARGSTALIGAVDGELMVTVERNGADPRNGVRGEPTGVKFVRTTKMRDGATRDLGAFKLESIILDRDEDGDTITSCVVRPVEYNRI